ncbi:copper amine oxidase, partial [Tribonema minus]
LRTVSTLSTTGTCSHNAGSYSSILSVVTNSATCRLLARICSLLQVAHGVNAQYHQHLFSVRLDFAVDDPDGGKGLVDIEALPESEDNPASNAFVTRETPLVTEKQAQSLLDPLKGRYFKVSNPASLHPVTGKPVAWKLMVPPCQLLLAGPRSALATKAAFATKHVWVTPHSDAERWPAGDYTIQAQGGEGLPKWTAADRDCGAGADPVIWLTLGATHAPRVEDFPVMPCEVVSFQLKPFCFFAGNPGVDLPAAPNAASTLANASAAAVENGHATNGCCGGH